MHSSPYRQGWAIDLARVALAVVGDIQRGGAKFQNPVLMAFWMGFQ